MRNTIIAGNWKMNTTRFTGLALAQEIANKVSALELGKRQVVLCPPFTHIHPVALIAKTAKGMAAGAQNCHQKENGAYTGEVSASMLADCGAEYVILGHSERRQYFGENEDLLVQKINAALSARLKVIYCCGETLQEREAGRQMDVVLAQVRNALTRLQRHEWASMVIAYEPVWAIGTGKTATSAQAQEMHQAIRREVAGFAGEDVAAKLHILYGGSMKPDNAAELLTMPDIDGGLIGGASLKADDFLAIIEAAASVEAA